MKFHRITVENLNSLYGRQTVDLERDLHDAPVFLIVGPTGAGKSTLLDAICLALFGQTPRLDRQTGRPETDVGHIVSVGAAEAVAQLEFSLREAGGGRTRYEATWSVRRAHGDPDGALQRPERSLVRHRPGKDPELLVSDHRKKRYQPHFDRVLHGLDVEDFKRSILLAQGDFSAFLHADEAEKASILERLTSTAQYKQIGARAAERRRQAHDRLEQLEAQLDDARLLTEAQQEALHDAITATTSEVEASRRARERARMAHRWMSELAGLRQERARQSEELEAARAELIERREDLARLEADEAVEHLESRVTRSRELQVKLEENRNQQVKSKSSIEEAERRHARARDATSEAREALEAARELHDVVSKLDRLRAARQQREATRQRLARLREELAGLVRERADAEELEAARREVVEERRRSLRRLEQLRAALDLRGQLVSGEPCPVCGSEDHPGHASHAAEGEAAQLADEQARLEEEIEAALTTLAEATERVQRLRVDEGARRTALAYEEEHLQSVEATIRADLADEPGDLDRALDERIDALEERAVGAGELLDGLAGSERLAALDAAERQAEAALESAEADERRAERALTEQRARLAALDEEESALCEARDQNQELLDRALADLNESLEQVGAALLSPAERRRLREVTAEAKARLGAASALLDEATRRLDAHVESRPDGVEFDDEITAYAAALEELDARLEAAAGRLGALRERLERHEEAAARREELRGELELARQDCETWGTIAGLIGVNYGDAFKEFAQSLNLRDLVEKANLRLEHLHPRYALDVARGEEGQPTLAFTVRDRYQADLQRPLTTLSGGETFLVSLALALALADYRRVQVPIETLLLDEGFGTLDQDSLHLAISTLHRLHDDGSRQIGIISHVEALKEMIDARIVVEKMGHGRSKLRFEVAGQGQG